MARFGGIRLSQTHLVFSFFFFFFFFFLIFFLKKRREKFKSSFQLRDSDTFNPFSNRQILDSSKLKVFEDDNFQ